MPLLRRWFSLLSSRTTGLIRSVSTAQFQTASLGAGNLSISATFTNPINVGNKLFACAVFLDGGAGTITGYTCSDTKGNIWTLQKANTDQSNGQGIAIFSAPCTVGGASDAVTVAISGGTISSASTSCIIGIYEVVGLISQTAVSTATHNSGASSFATTVVGTFILSGDVVNVSVAGTESFTGLLDISASQQMGVGRRSGTWSNSGTITFHQMTESAYN